MLLKCLQEDLQKNEILSDPRHNLGTALPATDKNQADGKSGSSIFRPSHPQLDNSWRGQTPESDHVGLKKTSMGLAGALGTSQDDPLDALIAEALNSERAHPSWEISPKMSIPMETDILIEEALNSERAHSSWETSLKRATLVEADAGSSSAANCWPPSG